MPQPSLFFVWGGVFTDTSFTELPSDAEECYGPFHDEAMANRIWNEKTRRNVDIAQHRMFVLTVPRPAG